MGLVHRCYTIQRLWSTITIKNYERYSNDPESNCQRQHRQISRRMDGSDCQVQEPRQPWGHLPRQDPHQESPALRSEGRPRRLVRAMEQERNLSVYVTYEDTKRRNTARETSPEVSGNLL